MVFDDVTVVCPTAACVNAQPIDAVSVNQRSEAGLVTAHDQRKAVSTWIVDARKRMPPNQAQGDDDFQRPAARPNLRNMRF
jgi:hypothetical protein